MEVLRIFGAMYVYAEAFEKAEPYLIKATDLEASLYHYDQGYGGLEYVNLLSLCSLYDRWGKPDRLEACECRLIPIVEKIPGPDTHLLELLLGQRAKALRTLGRAEEAAQAEQRLKALQPSAAVNPN